MYTLSLEIINKCNLNCTYCYLGEKKNTYMSLETAQKAIDIAVHEANKQYDRTLMVYFIGGEPLICYCSLWFWGYAGNAEPQPKNSTDYVSCDF